MRAGLPLGFYTANAGTLTIRLINGAVIWFKGADNPDSLYGEDVFAAVIDEASRVKEDSWYAVRSTLTATGGHVRIIGNVKGRKNWFYRLARRAEQMNGTKGATMSFHRLTADDAVEGGVVQREEVEDARAVLPDHVFRALYMAEPGDDEGNPFGITNIRNCILPISSRAVAARGVDLAKSIDWTVVIGLDDYGTTAQFERWQGPWTTTEARLGTILTPLGEDGPITVIDSTGVGDPIAERLGNTHRVEPYAFTQKSKQQLMEGLQNAIQTRRVMFPEGPIVRELEEFEFEYTRTGVRYSAPEGYHDDCVCALALAWHRLAQRPDPGRAVVAGHRRRTTA
jgi:phage FluMu gp28-like protein